MSSTLESKDLELIREATSCSQAAQIVSRIFRDLSLLETDSRANDGL